MEDVSILASSCWIESPVCERENLVNPTLREVNHWIIDCRIQQTSARVMFKLLICVETYAKWWLVPPSHPKAYADKPYSVDEVEQKWSPCC